MKITTVNEFERDYQSSIEALSRRGEFSLSFALPKDAGEQNALGRALAKYFDSTGGAVVIVTSTGIWPSSEDPHSVRMFRRALGEMKEVHETPVHIVTKSDVDNSATLISMCLHNYWDFVLLSHDKTTRIFASHDECADVFVESGEQLNNIREIITFFGLKELSDQ